jgi:hypothetical protein
MKLMTLKRLLNRFKVGNKTAIKIGTDKLGATVLLVTKLQLGQF